jgi:hypothetical protein
MQAVGDNRGSAWAHIQVAMRFATDGKALDRLAPVFVLPYAIWTVYVHLIVWAHASFTALLWGLPFMIAVAVAATAGWFRLRAHAGGQGSAVPVPPGPAGGEGSARIAPGAALAFAIFWVGLLSSGMPYAVFWWGALLAMGGAWAWHLRGDPNVPPQPGSSGNHPAWILPCVVVAAVCVCLVASRPAADDGFFLSIPATLLRLPGQPVLLHDTMYRLPEGPLLLPFYRLSNYGVLAAVIARLTGIDPLAVDYLVLPSLFAALSIVAWVYLLRRLVPARWQVVLPILFACVMALGEVNHAYGNFAFVRLFHGKSVLASCMVPVIAGAALVYMHHGGTRNWILLFATQVAALGVATSALFVAPAAAALALAGGWTPDRVHGRRMVLGMLATGYVFFAAWLMGSDPGGAHALALPAARPMPSVPQLLEQTWGPWSTPVLLVALLAAWAFVRDPVRARYFSAGAFFFVLVAINPYATPFVAAVSIGAKTYWRLTWALPLPFFLAVTLDGVVARALALKPKALAACSCLALAALAAAFASRSGTLLCANGVSLGIPGPKVPPLEYGVARTLAEQVPEDGVVLAPEAVSVWLPIFVFHPQTVGVRQMYLSSAFTPAETAQRSNMMRYVAGTSRPHRAEAWFAESVRRYRLSAVVFTREAPWGDEIERNLAAEGWRSLSCGNYVVLLRHGPIQATTTPFACDTRAAPTRP